ncbi:iron uptake transporter permease EfeU [Rouxiella sp. WC2420]|uniref:Iron uptake transporter permease EfeU n=1 Tax=Rouxiella sp. WC2420 TaxID=3234145 RepID=A0AB39VKN7_9GAMM
MLATFVIALREGLEAALIVGIIAAFLRKNGKSLSAMWIGVFLAVLLSVVVGVGLSMTERALPQASQESMEAVIGLVAVFFVTGMVMWMNTHAKNIKKSLEQEAAEAISQSSAFALASMAFLAVLKEGFETSVFLLATFSVAQSAIWAAVGAIIGLVMAVFIGWGLYAGGIRINLGRFFRFTGLFLILVAAGLIISALRSAHEAGWLNVGQDKFTNLMWLVPPGTVQSALISGVLGIPADPRQIEVMGWVLYIVLVALMVFWPARLRPAPKVAARAILAGAAALALSAASLYAFYPNNEPDLPASAPLVSNGVAAGQASLVNGDGAGYQLNIQSADGKTAVAQLPNSEKKTYRDRGVAVDQWTSQRAYTPEGVPAVLTLDQVVTLYGNRIPIGLNPGLHPGPYNAKWTVNCTVNVSVAQGALLSATGQAETLITLSGSGLSSPRTISAHGQTQDSACRWQVTDAYQHDVMSQLQNQRQTFETYRFWARLLPAFLALLAATCLMIALRRFFQLRQREKHQFQKEGLKLSSKHSTTLPDNK